MEDIYNDLTEVPLNKKKKNNMVGINTASGVKLFIYNGTKWKEEYERKNVVTVGENEW